MMDRVMVFIDGSNFYFGCKVKKVAPPWDMVALSSDLATKARHLIRVYYYNARSGKIEEDKFYDYLRRLDYCTVRLGRIEGEPGKKRQKGVDVLMVQDLLTLTFNNAFDVAIIVSNDGDFASVIEEAKARGKQIEVGFLDPMPAYQLRAACDKYINLLAACSKHFKSLPLD